MTARIVGIREEESTLAIHARIVLPIKLQGLCVISISYVSEAMYVGAFHNDAARLQKLIPNLLMEDVSGWKM